MNSKVGFIDESGGLFQAARAKEADGALPKRLQLTVNFRIPLRESQEIPSASSFSHNFPDPCGTD